MSKKLIEEVRRSGAELASADSARKAIEIVFDAVQALTQRGERVTVRGFGTFAQKERAERLGRNPRTGEEVKIMARKALTFKEAKD